MFNRRALIVGAPALAVAPLTVANIPITLRFKVVSGGHTVSEGTITSMTSIGFEQMLEAIHCVYRESGEDYCIRVTV